MCTCTFQGPVSDISSNQPKEVLNTSNSLWPVLNGYTDVMLFSRWLYISMCSISLFIALKQMLRSLLHCCCLPQSQVHMMRHYGMAESIWTPKNKDEQGWFLLLMEEILPTSWYGNFHCLQGFIHHRYLFGISEPSKVGNVKHFGGSLKFSPILFGMTFFRWPGFLQLFQISILLAGCRFKASPTASETSQWRKTTTKN